MQTRTKAYQRKQGWLVIIPLFTILVLPLYLPEVDAGTQGLIGSSPSKFKEMYYLRGDLTAPRDDKPYGGSVVGNYLMLVDFNEVKIIAEFEKPTSQSTKLKGWLVDLDTGTNFSVGQFDKESNKLFFHQENMEPQTYDWFVVIEEPIKKTNSRDPHTMGGAQVDVEFFIREPNRGE